MSQPSPEPAVTLVTGVSRGIGRRLAEHYLNRGHIVFGCSRSAPEEMPSGLNFVKTDITNESDVLRLMATIQDGTGRLSNLINNAGVASMNHSLLTPMETVRKVFEINTFGTFLLCREAAKLMRKAGSGRIVNFTTVAAPLKLEGEAAYAASKAAVLSLTQVLAREFAPLGITVNAVGPTPVQTDLIKHVPKQKLDQLVDRQAIKRMGEFRDVINVVDFFVQPSSDFVTGQVIYLGGVS